MASYKVLLSNSVRQDVRGIERIQLGRIMDKIRSARGAAASTGHSALPQDARLSSAGQELRPRVKRFDF